MNYVLQLTFIKSNFSHSFIAKFYLHNDKLNSTNKVMTQPTRAKTKKNKVGSKLLERLEGDKENCLRKKLTLCLIGKQLYEIDPSINISII